MGRGIGGAAFTESLPDAVVAVGGLVTQLGDMWFLLLAIGALYWRARAGAGGGIARAPLRDCLFLFALAVGTYALVAVLKAGFGLPRPPGATTATAPGWLPRDGGGFYDLLVTADGYGFPSGHAAKAAAVYVGGATVLTVGTRRLRYAVAGVLVALVALSRVVIGVHYLVDVVAGAAVGLAVLAALAYVRRPGRSPVRPLGVTGAFSVGAVAVAPSTETSLAVFGTGVGLGVWFLWGAPSLSTGISA